MRGQSFLDIVTANDALDIEEDLDTGHLLANVRIDSNMLPITQPDTYQTFNGDHAVEMDLEYYQEAFDFDLEWEDHDEEYDHTSILRDLSQACIDALPTSDDGVLRGVEYWNQYSPREYNFGTDSYDAAWTVDITALAEWLDSRDDDDTVEDTLCEIFKSRDGFMSHVPRYFRDETEWANVWGALWLWLQEEYDEESGFMGVAEEEGNIYHEHVTVHWSAHCLSKLSGWDEEDIQHELTQEDIDELVWDHVNEHHMGWMRAA